MEEAKRFIKNVHSDQYNLNGILYLLNDGHYCIELEFKGKTYSRRLEYVDKYTNPEDKDFMEHDIGWMSLENLYEDIILEMVT